MATGGLRREHRFLAGWTLALAVTSLLVVGVGSPSGASQGTGDVRSGNELFDRNCAMCHGGDARGMMGMHPSLRGAVDRLTVEGVEVTIRNGRDTRPPMPAFEGQLDDQQIADVVAYIGSLPSGPRNFGPESGGGGMGGMGDGMMSGRMWLVPLAAVLAIAFLVGAVVYAFRSRRSGSAAATPRAILDRRYAEGELTRDEYLQLRDDLDAG